MPGAIAAAACLDHPDRTGVEEVIPLPEETLVVGKRTVNSGTTRVRRFVVESAVEHEVALYDEKVVVEHRRPATDVATGESFTKLSIEVVETSEVPVVTKRVHVREEIVVRKQRSKCRNNQRTRIAVIRATFADSEPSKPSESAAIGRRSDVTPNAEVSRPLLQTRFWMSCEFVKIRHGASTNGRSRVIGYASPRRGAHPRSAYLRVRSPARVRAAGAQSTPGPCSAGPAAESPDKCGR